MITWRRFNGIRIVGYVVLTPVAYFAGWLQSVIFVSLISIWALVETAIASWRADVPIPKDVQDAVNEGTD